MERFTTPIPRPSLVLRSRTPFFLSRPPRVYPVARPQNFSFHLKERRRSRISMSLSGSSPAAIGTSHDVGVKGSSSSVVGEKDLLIVGPGVLGRMVAEKWRQENPGCQIFGQTMTTDHHDELVEVGIVPSLAGTKAAHQFPYVIFCAPASQTADYPGDVSPVVPIGASPRMDVLLKAENAALDAGGCVLRLAGLYKVDRGAHVYWLEKGSVDARPDHILNLIHYEDAASLSIAIMQNKFWGRIFVGCDNHPLSRQEIMDFVNQSGKFNKKFQGFTGTDGPLGKRMNNSRTRAEIGWEPKYASFLDFLRQID
ncbi:uncharacterized protein [Elaeis guineensis]|uniref:Uncharacterized protein LOC105032125 isoform X3 n=1 Tax=Elaeis guineensis var. tenera TaxID=51953 RepID=A0A6J0PBC9_ELAGV|nr:uncharacterized protein LOC105032125 isoform X3 [Elaeis guineensis]